MGKMKDLYTALQETERLLREYDPIAFEAGRRIVEQAGIIALSSGTGRPPQGTPVDDERDSAV